MSRAMSWGYASERHVEVAQAGGGTGRWFCAAMGYVEERR